MDTGLYVPLGLFTCSVVSDSATPWKVAHQASLSITNSQCLLKLTSTESVIPSNHLILWRGQEGKDWKPEPKKGNNGNLGSES